MKSQKWQRNHNFVTIGSENPKVLITGEQSGRKDLISETFPAASLSLLFGHLTVPSHPHITPTVVGAL